MYTRAHAVVEHRDRGARRQADDQQDRWLGDHDGVVLHRLSRWSSPRRRVLRIRRGARPPTRAVTRAEMIGVSTLGWSAPVILYRPSGTRARASRTTDARWGLSGLPTTGSAPPEKLRSRPVSPTGGAGGASTGCLATVRPVWAPTRPVTAAFRRLAGVAQRLHGRTAARADRSALDDGEGRAPGWTRLVGTRSRDGAPTPAATILNLQHDRKPPCSPALGYGRGDRRTGHRPDLGQTTGPFGTQPRPRRPEMVVMRTVIHREDWQARYRSGWIITMVTGHAAGSRPNHPRQVGKQERVARTWSTVLEGRDRDLQGLGAGVALVLISGSS